MTYYSLIGRIQKDIQEIEEKISGKRGFDYWIDYYENKKDDTKLSIDKTEKELNDIRYSTVTTKPPKNNKKKSKRTKANQGSGPPILKTDSKRSKRKKRQIGRAHV